MNVFRVEQSQVINASPEAIYAVLSDYEVGHPAIVPKPYFEGITVDKGGRGAGTEIQVHMVAFGKKRTVYQVVTEPEPGRVLVETDKETGLSTTFTVEPLNDGAQARVTIASEIDAGSGLMGMVQKRMMPPMIRRVFKKELDLLAEYVQREHTTTD